MEEWALPSIPPAPVKHASAERHSDRAWLDSNKGRGRAYWGQFVGLMLIERGFGGAGAGM